MNLSVSPPPSRSPSTEPTNEEEDGILTGSAPMCVLGDDGYACGGRCSVGGGEPLTTFCDSAHGEGDVFGEEVVGEDEDELARFDLPEGTSCGTAPNMGDEKGGGECRGRPAGVIDDPGCSSLGGTGSLSLRSHASEQYSLEKQ